MVACALLGFAVATDVEAKGPWTSIGPEGGFVQAVAIDPDNTSALYAGTLGGGVFKSSDGGAHWVGISNGLAARGRSTFSELRRYAPVAAAMATLSPTFWAEWPGSV